MIFGRWGAHIFDAYLTSLITGIRLVTTKRPPCNLMLHLPQYLARQKQTQCVLHIKQIIFILRQSFTVSPNTLLCVNKDTDSYNNKILVKRETE